MILVIQIVERKCHKQKQHSFLGSCAKSDHMSRHCMLVSLIANAKVSFLFCAVPTGCNGRQQKARGDYIIHFTFTATLVLLFCPFVFRGSENKVSLSVGRRQCNEEPHVTNMLSLLHKQLFDCRLTCTVVCSATFASTPSQIKLFGFTVQL